jgi:hypothetical protein
MDVKPGDTLVIYRESSWDHDARRRTVTFVGNRWISVDGEQVRFDRETGGNSGRYIDPRAFTEEQWNDRQMRRQVQLALRERGIEVTSRCTLDTARLRVILTAAVEGSA